MMPVAEGYSGAAYQRDGAVAFCTQFMLDASRGADDIEKLWPEVSQERINRRSRQHRQLGCKAPPVKSRGLFAGIHDKRQ